MNKYLILLFTVLLSHNLFAVNIQQFVRSNSLTYEMLDDVRLPFSHVDNQYDWLLTLGGSWVDEPLAFKNQQNTQKLGTVIGNMYGAHLGAAWYAKHNLMLGLVSSYNFFEDINGKKRQGFTDIELKAKWAFLKKDTWGLAIAPFISLPTGAGGFEVPGIGYSKFLSDESFGLGVRLIGEILFKKWQFTTNIGYRRSDKAKFQDINMVDQVYTGIGTYVPILSSLGANIEWARLWSFPLFNTNQNPNELYLGLSAALRHGLHTFAGLSLGNLEVQDGNSWRVSGGVKFYWPYQSDPILDRQGHPSDTLVPIYKSDFCVPKVFGDTNTAVVRYANDIGSLSDESKINIIKVLKQILDKDEYIQNITVVGHTSTPGSDTYNLRLSQNRANSIKQLLIESGIGAQKIEAIGKGEAATIAVGNSENTHKSNRRVEFKIHYKSDTQTCEK